MKKRLGRVSSATAMVVVMACLVAEGGCSSTPTKAAEKVVEVPACRGEPFDGAPLSIRCGAFVDASGREVFLHGVNARVSGLFDVTFDDGRTALEPIPEFTAADATNMRSVGFNALRLPLNWSGLEPTETGGFSAPYLDRIAEVVALARAADLYVLLDMHQDAYSKEIGEDGAPYWAIVPAPPAKLQGPLLDLEARRLSKPVADAFETFFGPTQDGARLRTRFANATREVAKRFANDPAVVGIEAFNEPLATEAALDVFHNEIVAAVRAVAPKMLVFFEPSAVRNLTDRASIPAKPLGPGTVYAPHVYTLAFTGTESSIAAMTKETLRPSNENASLEAQAWGTPLVVGEFGFSPTSPRFADYVAFQSELQDEVHASSFFWLWKEDSQGAWGLYDRTFDRWAERPSVITALTRMRLERVAGRLGKTTYDRAEQKLVFSFEGVEGATGDSVKNVVSTGRLSGALSVTCDGKGLAAEGKGPIVIPCGGAGGHEVVVRSAR